MSSGVAGVSDGECWLQPRGSCLYPGRTPGQPSRCREHRTLPQFLRQEGRIDQGRPDRRAIQRPCAQDPAFLPCAHRHRRHPRHCSTRSTSLARTALASMGRAGGSEPSLGQKSPSITPGTSILLHDEAILVGPADLRHSNPANRPSNARPILNRATRYQMIGHQAVRPQIDRVKLGRRAALAQRRRAGTRCERWKATVSQGRGTNKSFLHRPVKRSLGLFQSTRSSTSRQNLACRSERPARR